jgi:hypothetical protein
MDAIEAQRTVRSQTGHRAFTREVPKATNPYRVTVCLAGAVGVVEAVAGAGKTWDEAVARAVTYLADKPVLQTGRTAGAVPVPTAPTPRPVVAPAAPQVVATPAKRRTPAPTPKPAAQPSAAVYRVVPDVGEIRADSMSMAAERRLREQAATMDGKGEPAPAPFNPDDIVERLLRG